MPQSPEEYRPTQQRKAPPSQRYADGFYDRRAWRNASRTKLKAEPLCRECGEPAACVDHVVPLARGGEPYALQNLQSLCRSCHMIKTNREQRGG